MKIVVYKNKEDNEYPNVEEYSILPLSENEGFWLDEGDTFIKEFQGEDWNDCMRQYHEFMGWEPYKPMEDE